jgi:beta-galactosidase
MRIVDEMASCFKDHPGVFGYQIDNEYGCHNTVRSTSPASATKFRSYLREKYNDSLQALNDAYGAVFWSQAYSDWDQILPPTNANTVPADHNPSLVLDFKRFSSDTWIRFNEAQVKIIKKHNPSHWTTHNMMLYYFHYDMPKLGATISAVSWDNYETYGTHPICVAANHDWMYGARSEPFWVMEQQLGQVNWDMYNSQWRPGRLSLKVMQSIAHGANGMMYFRWRQCPFGIEQYHSGLLDHAGRETRFLREVTQVNEQLRLLEKRGLFAQHPSHDVALVHDSDSHWALESQPHNSKSLGFTTPGLEPCLWVADTAPLTPSEPKNKSGLYILHHYEMLLRRRLGVNILDVTRACELVIDEADSTVTPKYKIVCFPQLHVVDQAMVETIKAYVSAGGVAIFGPRSGYKTEYNNLHDDSPQPGCGLGDLVGLEVEEFDTSEEGVTQAVVFQDEGENDVVTAAVWYEKLQVKAKCRDSAKIWARYGKRKYEPPPKAEWYNPELPKGVEPYRTANDDFDIQHFYEGSPAVIANDYGNGKAIYIGCMGKQVFDFALQKVMGGEEGGLFDQHAMVVGGGDAEVEVCRRGDWYFLMNHSNEAKICNGLPVGLENAVTADGKQELLDPTGNGRVELAPFSYKLGYWK